MDKRTKVILAWELHQQGTPHSHIAARLDVHRETVGLWCKAITTQGLLPFLDKKTVASRVPHPLQQTPLRIKQKVWFLREREHNCCGQKIAYFLEKEDGIHLSVPTIYQILAQRYTLRSKKRKNIKRGPVPHAFAPRQVIQMDTVDFDEVFAFTAVDIFTKEADIYLAPALTSEEGKAFLIRCMNHRFAPGQVELVQTDGGPEFKGEFVQVVGNYCQRHRVARPYKKNEQSFIESFNKTVRSECLGWSKYKACDIPDLTDEVTTFLHRYHFHRPHLGLSPLRPPLPLL